MKTAISIPDTLFKRAEKLIKKSGITRSRLFCTALEEYLERHTPKDITAKLNKVYGSENSSVDDNLLYGQTKSIMEKNNDPW